MVVGMDEDNKGVVAMESLGREVRWHDIARNECEERAKR